MGMRPVSRQDRDANQIFPHEKKPPQKPGRYLTSSMHTYA